MKFRKILIGILVWMSACSSQPPHSQAQVVQMEVHSVGKWTIYRAPEWNHEAGPPYISSIAVANDGTVCLGTIGGSVSNGTGVYCFDGQSWRNYTTENGLSANDISSITANPDGSLWFTTFCCGAARFDGKVWRKFGTADGLASTDVRSSAAAADGSMWFGTSGRGVSRFNGNTWKTYTMQNGLWGNFVGHIDVLPEGGILISNSNQNGARLTRYDGQHWETFSVPPGLANQDKNAPGNYVKDIAVGPDGSLWFATEKDGVYHLKENTWTHYTTQDGLASNDVYCALTTLDGTLWFGTSLGVSHFDGEKWASITQQGQVSCPMAAASDGSIWFGGASAVFRYQP